MYAVEMRSMTKMFCVEVIACDTEGMEVSVFSS